MATATRSAPRPPVQATGRVVRDREGLDLLLQRKLPLSAEEAWAWLTSSARLRKWIGSWRGTAAVGAEVAFTMTFEKDAATEPVTIVACDPNARLLLDLHGQRMGFSLAEADGSTTVYFHQRVGDYREAGLMGPGWEYYFDRLVAAVNGTTMPEFSDYHPAQQPYFERLALDGDPEDWTFR